MYFWNSILSKSHFPRIFCFNVNFCVLSVLLCFVDFPCMWFKIAGSVRNVWGEMWRSRGYLKTLLWCLLIETTMDTHTLKKKLLHFIYFLSMFFIFSNHMFPFSTSKFCEMSPFSVSRKIYGFSFNPEIGVRCSKVFNYQALLHFSHPCHIHLHTHLLPPHPTHIYRLFLFTNIPIHV